MITHVRSILAMVALTTAIANAQTLVPVLQETARMYEEHRYERYREWLRARLAGETDDPPGDLCGPD